MARLRRSELKDQYLHQALKVMVKHDIPTLDNVHHQLCMRGNCPAGQCNFPQGFRFGKECGHVLAVKDLITNMLAAANGD